MNDNGKLTISDTGKANLLDHKPFLNDNNKALPHIQNAAEHPQLRSVTITEDDITTTLKS